MRWSGFDAFQRELRRIAQDLPQHVAQGNRRTAEYMRTTALGNMDGYGIRRITGVSRDRYTATEGQTAANALVGDVSAQAGYLAWPADLVFYPRFLNDGTSRMVARPYHDTAFEASGPVHAREMEMALLRALRGVRGGVALPGGKA